MGYSFRLTARVLLYAPSHRQDSTYHGLCYTSRGALAGTRNSMYVCVCVYIYIYNEFALSHVTVFPFFPSLLTIYYPEAHPVWLKERDVAPWLYDWCNKGCPVCGMVHIKESLLLIGRSNHIVEQRVSSLAI